MKRELQHSRVKHIVVLMLENRGFDHLMGWLYRPGDDPSKIISRESDNRDFFLGLSDSFLERDGLSLEQLANPFPERFQPVPAPMPPRRGARSPKTPRFNPGEKFAGIMNQMWGKNYPASDWQARQFREANIGYPQKGPMTGYILDYDLDIQHNIKDWYWRGVKVEENELSEIMDMYLPEQLPVLSGLARSFAVSDEWFCSVPSQTNTNRAFSMAGTSRGLVNNSFYDFFRSTNNPRIKAMKCFGDGGSHSDRLPVSTRCLFEILEQFDFDWKVYWQSPWPPIEFTKPFEYQYVKTMFPLLENESFKDNFVKFDANDPNNVFFAAARRGELPSVSWIEPKWGGGVAWDSLKRIVGNDYHPVSDTTVGEDFVMNVYQALAASSKWSETLFVITFDENGGTYDHVFPPPAYPSCNDRVPLKVPEKQAVIFGLDDKTKTQFGYEFTQFGIRVPTVVISPWINEKTVFRSRSDIPFDHTSTIATILKMAGIEPQYWLLGDRVNHAPTFEYLLSEEFSAPNCRIVSNPGASLKVPVPGPVGQPLSYGTPYGLEYVGNRWPANCDQRDAEADSGKRYLGPPEFFEAINRDGKWVRKLRPTLTYERSKAAEVKFAKSGNASGNPNEPITNMDMLYVGTETEKFGPVYLSSKGGGAELRYARQAGGISWQIRILSSRDSKEGVRIGNDVYFMVEIPGKDPTRLMAASPDSKYLINDRGEWALWKVIDLAAEPPAGVGEPVDEVD
jgi:phospholipase C